MKLDWTGAMYKVLGPGGSHQSIRSERMDCAVNLVERSSITLDSVCNKPEFGGAEFESWDTMGFTDEEYPYIKGDALLKLPPNLAVE